MCKKLLVATSIVLLILPFSRAEASTISASRIESMVNAARQSAGLLALSHNSLLAQAAQAKADDMARKSYFSHTSPDGRQFQYWVEASGYKYASAGENLAIHTADDAEAIISSWMKSPGHKANIVASKFTETGVGVAYGTYQGQPTIFIAQTFGSPRVVATQQVADPVAAEPKVASVPTSVQATTPAPAAAQVQAPVAPVHTVKVQPKVAGTTTPAKPEVKSEEIETTQASVTIESSTTTEDVLIATPVPVSAELEVRPISFGEFLAKIISKVSDAFSQMALALVA